ncbi:ion channel domain-containing protein [Ditylenchus destructor]|nr:ion channel domain-containing protein [Ditylenchus destructor]
MTRRETIYVPVPVDDGFHMDSDESDGSLAEQDRNDIELNLNRIQTSDGEDDSGMNMPQTKKEKFIRYSKMVLPHVGLVLLLICYLLIGATVFHYLEAPNELLTKDREIRTIFELRDAFHENIWNLTHSIDTVISQESFNGIGQEYFEKLVTAIFSAYRNQFINERHLLNTTTDDEMLWTYVRSVFFATTVVTTIGYGHLVPATQFGRIACICFALFGIPLLLVTIADIGKFLSEMLSFLYRKYRMFKRKVRKQSRRLSKYRERTLSSRSGQSDASSTNMSSDKPGPTDLNDYEDEASDIENEQLRIPVIMVLFVLVTYTAIGGFLFREWEGWPYFDAFYFCFITIATVGFGDIVPTEQVYMFFTMAYIIFGLSLATMCIDLAGTEYIRKIHYLGTKMEDAKGAMISGLHVGENILKHTGIEVIRTASGKLVRVRGAVLNSKQARDLGLEHILSDPQYQKRNWIYDPPTPAVLRLIKSANIKILPDDITDRDGFVVSNKGYTGEDKTITKQFLLLESSPNVIYRFLRPAKRRSTAILVPFVLKESDI